MITKDSVDKQQNALAEIIKLEIDSALLDNSKNIVLLQRDIVNVRKKPIYETFSAVLINGRVEYPGSYMLQNNTETIYDLIQRAGDLKPDANPNGIHIVRKIDRLLTDKIEKIEVKIPIDYSRILKNINSRQNIYLRPSDEIIIPKLKPKISVFEEIEFNVGKDKVFKITAQNTSSKNRYIQSATLNGKAFDRSWIDHSEIMAGGELAFVMGDQPNKTWATSKNAAPYLQSTQSLASRE